MNEHSLKFNLKIQKHAEAESQLDKCTDFTIFLTSNSAQT